MLQIKVEAGPVKLVLTDKHKEVPEHVAVEKQLDQSVFYGALRESWQEEHKAECQGSKWCE